LRVFCFSVFARGADFFNTRRHDGLLEDDLEE
jgi:hypothetical protein